ncbi:restriction endonuclease fold toxin-2 domain-containing protein [Streptomyces sp. NPDC102467]|uniref:restriction endonuclease fold toxin-2 domain-containing protein n=1 Tax=Streptomyces sp. NPDC102467 TaxID=3366179 RepID=UPI00381F9089
MRVPGGRIEEERRLVVVEIHEVSAPSVYRKGLIRNPEDEKELGEYKLAMDSHQQIRGLEIVTNDQDSVAYLRRPFRREPQRRTTVTPKRSRVSTISSK